MSSDPIRSELASITECSICTEIYSDPRSLPCLHTFCLTCLEQCNPNKRPRANAVCPLCRKVFKIPVNGLGGLPKNFLMEKMIQIKDMPSAPLVDQTGMDVVDELKRQLTDDLQNVSIGLRKSTELLTNLSKYGRDFASRIDQIELAVCTNADQLKRIIDDQKQALVTELQTVKQERLKQVENLCGTISPCVALLNRSKQDIEELSQKGTAVDMAREMTRVHNKTNELLRVPCALNEFGSVDVKFVSMPIVDDKTRNMIGRIEVIRTSKNQSMLWFIIFMSFVFTL